MKMNKKEFEKLVGYKVTDGYYNDAVRAFGLANGITPGAFASEWAAGADSSELVKWIVFNADAIGKTLDDQSEEYRDRLKEILDLKGQVKRLREDRDRVKTNATSWMQEATHWKEEAMKLYDRAEAAEKAAQQVVKTDELEAALRSRAERAEADAKAAGEELARWRSAAEGMKRRMQTMIEAEIIKTGWRAVNFQPCALLLQLLREELPEFDVIEYLKQLSDKYNR